MNWLARLKKTGYAPAPTLQTLQNPDEGGFVGFVAYPAGDIQKIVPIERAAKDPTPHPDRWPAGDALNKRETDTHAARLAHFTGRGIALGDSEALADNLVQRDRDRYDTRRVCLECKHLTGWGGSLRCNQWRAAGLGAAVVPADLVRLLQHCDGFAAH
jgi:hypothetical protein